MNSRGYSKTVNMVLSAMFAALFFVSSNVLPPIYILPGAPLTFQVLVIALMAAVLSTKAALMTFAGILGLTAVGIPMMSGFSGGIGAFMKPSSGFMAGWLFILLSVGLYRDFAEPRLVKSGRFGPVLTAAGFAVSGGVGLALDYLCGAVSMSLYNGAGLMTNFIMNIAAYALLDMAKIAVAFAVSRSLEKALRKVAKTHAAG